MRQIDTSLAVLGLVLGLSAAAGAQPAAEPAVHRVGPDGAGARHAARGDDDRRGGRGERMFERLDADGDGRVTREEVAAARAERHAGHDANGDGRVDADEFEAAWVERAREMARRRFEALDANGDGVLGADEGRDDRAERMFEHLDADGDGAISREEMEERRRHRTERSGHHRRHGPDAEPTSL